MESLKKNFFQGMGFIRDNTQIVYTIVLLILIPAAFLLTSQRFLSVALKNQERIEQERVGLMQDTFAEFSGEKLDDPSFLQEKINGIRDINPTITNFRIARFSGDAIAIIASTDKAEIGRRDEEAEAIWKSIGLPAQSSAIFQTNESGERHWKAFRVIRDASQNPKAVLMTNISMSHIDAVNTANIRKAYYLLALIIAAIFILLLRHARIIDYTNLYRRLKEVDKMKDDFIAIASHELRAPLTAIEWQIESAKAGLKDSKTLEIVKESAAQLARLIEDILDVSRIEQGRIKMNLQSTHAENILEKVTGLLRPTALAKGLSFSYEKKDLPPVSADPDRLTQIFMNLINNAIKYTLQGEVKIETAQDDAGVTVRIRDTGLGISAEEQKRLFQKFYRIKSPETRDIRGTGLGLWIARELTLRMNGSLSVESILGVGSSFIVSFPQPEQKS
ncbi:MAG: HAMP domain-containing histidine kinase [Candidatus Ryanbacteria bacterium]|nr:HAMP domain-containing histidine kinase [Candidatus Ryanbacteria bacterium]